MKIAILGHFASGAKKCNGQTIKTLALQNAFEKYTDVQLENIDTYNWKKRPLKLIALIKQAMKNNDAIIMLPAHNGVQVFARLLVRLNKKYKIKLYYDVIGGWLSEMLQHKKSLNKALMQFDGILLETQKMYKEMQTLGYENLFLLPNFKDIEPVECDKKSIYSENTKKLCTFSRVVEVKGISDIINAAQKLNVKYNFVLDIYGPIDENYKEKFEDLLSEEKGFVNYCGVAKPDESVKIISGYYALAFPTKYTGEGIPGTIIDSFYSGTPIVASKWNSYSDMLDDSVAIGYAFGNNGNDLEKALEQMLNLGEKEYLQMSKNCYNRSNDYNTKTQILKLKNFMERV